MFMNLHSQMVRLERFCCIWTTAAGQEFCKSVMALVVVGWLVLLAHCNFKRKTIFESFEWFLWVLRTVLENEGNVARLAVTEIRSKSKGCQGVMISYLDKVPGPQLGVQNYSDSRVISVLRRKYYVNTHIKSIRYAKSLIRSKGHRSQLCTLPIPSSLAACRRKTRVEFPECE